MGATKIKVKNIERISTKDLLVDAFELGRDMGCTFLINEPVDLGEMVLIKASFKNACENEEFEDDQVLYRRRVVPFVTRVVQSGADSAPGKIKVKAQIESITEEDWDFFCNKFFADSDDEPLNLELEGKYIQFAMV